MCTLHYCSLINFIQNGSQWTEKQKSDDVVPVAEATALSFLLASSVVLPAVWTNQVPWD